MKKIIFCFCVALSLLSCSSIDKKDDRKNENRVATNYTTRPEISDLKEQIFIINTSNDTILTGEKGTKLILSSKSFLDKTGKTIEGDVEIRLTEFYSIKDMILHDLSTESDSGLLQSNGMVKFEAFIDGDKLEIDPNKTNRISFPNNDTTFLLFQGKRTTSKMQWTLSDFFMETYDGDGNLLVRIPSGLSKLSDNSYKLLSLGYLNSDKYINEKEEVPFIVKIDRQIMKEEIDMNIYVIFNRFNSILIEPLELSEIVTFEKTPYNESCYVLCLGVSNGKIYFDMTSTNTKNGTINIKPVVVEKDEFDSNLEKVFGKDIYSRPSL